MKELADIFFLIGMFAFVELLEHSSKSLYRIYRERLKKYQETGTWPYQKPTR